MRITSKGLGAAKSFFGMALTFAGLALLASVPYEGWRENPFGVLLICAGAFVGWFWPRNLGTPEQNKAMGRLQLFGAAFFVLRLFPDRGWWLLLTLPANLALFGYFFWARDSFKFVTPITSRKPRRVLLWIGAACLVIALVFTIFSADVLSGYDWDSPADPILIDLILGMIGLGLIASYAASWMAGKADSMSQ